MSRVRLFNFAYGLECVDDVDGPDDGLHIQFELLEGGFVMLIVCSGGIEEPFDLCRCALIFIDGTGCCVDDDAGIDLDEIVSASEICRHDGESCIGIIESVDAEIFLMDEDVHLIQFAFMLYESQDMLSICAVRILYSAAEYIHAMPRC